MSKAGRRTRREREVAVTLMECGAGWPSYIEQLRSRASEHVVFSQDVTETPSAFATRVERRLMRLEAAGQTIRAAMVVAGRGRGDDVSAARCRIAATVARLAPPEDAQDLVLVGNALVPHDAREDLASLTATLSACFGLPGIVVRLVLEPRHSRVVAAGGQAWASAAMESISISP